MDGADKLLSDEFVECVDRLMAYTYKERQILLFYATFPKHVKLFKDKWITYTYEINLIEELTLNGVTQYYAFVDERQKVHCLITLLGNSILTKILFSRTWLIMFLYSCYDDARPSFS